MTSDGDTSREASIVDALIPLVALAVLIGASLALFGLKALDGPIQVGLILCCAVAALIALKNGHKWTAVQEAGQGAMSSITSAIFILLAVGALIRSWNLSGTIPTLVYYGIQVLSPGYYYVAAAVICGVVAMFDRQFVDDGRHHRRWAGGDCHHAGRVERDYRRRGGFRRLPRRQALAPVGDDDFDRPDGQGGPIHPHPKSEVDVDTCVRDRRRGVHCAGYRRPTGAGDGR